MCTFVTAIVPAETALPQLRQLCQKHGFDVNPMNNASLRTMMPDGYQFLPVGGSCNCDTPLGYALSATSPAHNLGDEISKLKRKGWSLAKIERWKRDKERSPQQKKDQKETELRQWEHWIREVLDTKLAKSITIVLHFYGAGIDAERIPIKSIEKVRMDALGVHKLAHLEPDILYQFSAT